MLARGTFRPDFSIRFKLSFPGQDLQLSTRNRSMLLPVLSVEVVGHDSLPPRAVVSQNERPQEGHAFQSGCTGLPHELQHGSVDAGWAWLELLFMTIGVCGWGETASGAPATTVWGGVCLADCIICEERSVIFA